MTAGEGSRMKDKYRYHLVKTDSAVAAKAHPFGK
jgi:hypothetical protein